MKRYLNTLIALALFLGLWGGFNYYNRRKAKKIEQTALKPAASVLGISAAHIQSVSLTPRDGKTITCRLQGKKWTIVAPEAVPADTEKIQSFVNTVATAAEDHEVEAHPSSLKDYGLDPPSETIQVQSNTNPKSATLLLGDLTPTNEGVYAQVQGSPRVFTLPGYMKSSLEKSLFDLRDTRAITLDADSINRIEADSGGKKFTLAKNPEGDWELDLPPAVRADRFTVQSLTDAVRGLTMANIVEEDKKNQGKYGFAKPTLTLKLATPDGSQTLVVGKLDGGNYDAMNSALAPIFTLATSSITPFQKTAADLRDKDLFSWDEFDVTKIELDTPKGHFALTKQGDKWNETAPAAKTVAADKVTNLLTSLRDLRATTFPAAKPGDSSAFGLNKPTYTLKVTYGNKNQTQIVEAVAASGHAYARRSDDPLPSEVTPSSLQDIDKALSSL